MFTGIVKGKRPITGIAQRKDGLEFVINLQDLHKGLKIGDSVAINGVCLTVIAQNDATATFHAMPETLRKTTMQHLKEGDLVNIERSLQVGDTMDGHSVQGHVFGTIPVTQRIEKPEEFMLWFNAGELAKYIAPLGSVAINGVSLTIAQKKGQDFAVSLIPITRELTNLGDLQKGDRVNIEPDIIARQVIHYLESYQASLAP